MSTFAALLLCVVVIHAAEAKIQNACAKVGDVGKVGQPRVYDGKHATLGQFPYVAAYIRTTNDSVDMCTGSIIHEKWILTAAHCLRKGVEDVDQQPEEEIGVSALISGGLDGLIYKVKTSYPHPEYHSGDISRDIGLVELLEELTWSDNVRPIRLGAIKEGDEIPVLFTGYGRGDKNKPKGGGMFLNYIMFKTLSPNACLARIRPSTLNADTFCAYGGMGKTIGTGDSGGPLVDLRDCTQVGIPVGVLDFTGKLPHFYLNISIYLPWIKNVTGVDFTTYKIN